MVEDRAAQSPRLMGRRSHPDVNDGRQENSRLIHLGPSYAFGRRVTDHSEPDPLKPQPERRLAGERLRRRRSACGAPLLESDAMTGRDGKKGIFRIRSGAASDHYPGLSPVTGTRLRNNAGSDSHIPGNRLVGKSERIRYILNVRPGRRKSERAVSIRNRPGWSRIPDHRALPGCRKRVRTLRPAAISTYESEEAKTRKANENLEGVFTHSGILP